MTGVDVGPLLPLQVKLPLGNSFLTSLTMVLQSCTVREVDGSPSQPVLGTIRGRARQTEKCGEDLPFSSESPCNKNSVERRRVLGRHRVITDLLGRSQKDPDRTNSFRLHGGSVGTETIRVEKRSKLWTNTFCLEETRSGARVWGPVPR